MGCLTLYRYMEKENVSYQDAVVHFLEKVNASKQAILNFIDEQETKEEIPFVEFM